ncbi:MAG: hypothetical protein HY072_01715 [Deltaproteobacteria bacterium]|nr:hypothetical protein [Deltaproteobacteria bacterium]
MKALLVFILTLFGLNALADQVPTDLKKNLKDRGEVEENGANRAGP